MISWSSFWQILIIANLVGFAVLSLFVTIGGARDVLAMFRRIDRQHEQADKDIDAARAPAEVLDADVAIAEGLLLQGSYLEAVELVERCAVTADQVGARMVLPTVYRVLGFAHLSLGRYGEARLALDRALDLSSGQDLQHERGFVLLGLSQLARAEGDPRAVRLERESARALADLGVVAAPVPQALSVDVRIPAQTVTDLTLPA